MPTTSRPEDNLIRLFLSAYENDAWAGCRTNWLDQQQDGAVEVLATRSDERTLAIEHTLIEFFIGEREDLERFKLFLPIEQDQSLHVPGKIIYVDVPRGVLQKGQPWNRVVDGVHDWLRANIRSIPTGESMQTCMIGGGMPDVILQVRVIAEPDFDGHPLIRRYGPVDVGETVEKALKAKLPKLVDTVADKRILLLERNQWSLNERDIHDEIEKRRPAFPALAQVDEVWLVETVAASSDGLRGYVDFKLYLNRQRVETIAFRNGTLFSRSKNGMPLAIARTH